MQFIQEVCKVGVIVIKKKNKMFKKISVIVLLGLFAVSCGSSKSPLSGKKKRKSELVSKQEYREKSKKQQILEQEVARAAANKAAAQKKKESERLVATSSVTVTADLIQDYILTYKEIAKANMREHGVPASITLAQGVLESGSGQGTLSVNANNHFGIKCHTTWDGPSVRHTDDAPDECFRKYETVEESYRDHSLFLVNRSRYNTLFTLNKGDYKGWANGLKKAGYATDPNYAAKLISLIDRYSLDKYDKEVIVAMGWKASESSENQVVVKQEQKQSFNKSHTVKKGDTLYSISKKYNTTVSHVQNLNKLKTSSLSIGQVLKI